MHVSNPLKIAFAYLVRQRMSQGSGSPGPVRTRFHVGAAVINTQTDSLTSLTQPLFRSNHFNAAKRELSETSRTAAEHNWRFQQQVLADFVVVSIRTDAASTFSMCSISTQRRRNRSRHHEWQLNTAGGSTTSPGGLHVVSIRTDPIDCAQFQGSDEGIVRHSSGS